MQNSLYTLFFKIMLGIAFFSIPFMLLQLTADPLSWAMRDQFKKVEKNHGLAGEPRVLLLGDSTIAQIDQADLPEFWWNAALGGSTYTEWIAQIKKYYKSYKSLQKVVIGFSEPDSLGQNVVMVYSYIPLLWSWKTIIDNFLIEAWQPISFFEFSMAKLIPYIVYAQDIRRSLLSLYIPDYNFLLFQQMIRIHNREKKIAKLPLYSIQEAMIQLHNWADGNRLRLVLVLMPVQSKLEKNDNRRRSVTTFMQSCRKLNITCKNFQGLVDDNSFADEKHIRAGSAQKDAITRRIVGAVR